MSYRSSSGNEETRYSYVVKALTDLIFLLGTRRSWRVGADCKSVAFWLSRFESYRAHKKALFICFIG